MSVVANNRRTPLDGLELCIDFANPKCYAGSGTLVKNLGPRSDVEFQLQGEAVFTDGAVRFNGTDTLMELGPPLVVAEYMTNPSSDISGIVLMRPRAIGTDQAIISQRIGIGLSFFLADSGQLAFRLDDSNNMLSDVTLVNDTWYTLGFTLKQGSPQSVQLVKLFVNGVKSFDGVSSDTSGYNDNLLWLGWQARTDYNPIPGLLNADLSAALLWRTLRSEEEMLDLHRQFGRRVGLV